MDSYYYYTGDIVPRSATYCTLAQYDILLATIFMQ